MIQIDMEMPEKCGLCPLFHAEHPMYCQGVKADRKKKIVAPYRDPRPEWCPIPEIQPDPDTVSRKAVLDAVCEELDSIDHVPQWVFDRLTKKIENLPSAQPEKRTENTRKTHGVCLDTISRNAAIDALMKRDKELRNINWYDKPFAEGECKGIDDALEIINTLPSAQSTMGQVFDGDTINRQAAIDICNNAIDLWHGQLGEGIVIAVKKKIEELPSAQPEIIRCNDCKHWTQTTGNMRGFGLGDCDYINAKLVNCNGFCYWAERRTDD